MTFNQDLEWHRQQQQERGQENQRQDVAREMARKEHCPSEAEVPSNNYAYFGGEGDATTSQSGTDGAMHEGPEERPFYSMFTPVFPVPVMPHA